jgi:hypothetical protein
VTPPTAFFGDTLVADVDVLVDPHRIDPATVSVDGGFSPYESGKPVVQRRNAGGMVRLVYTLSLRCFVAPCVPPDPARGGRRTFDFGPVTVAFAGVDRTRRTLLLNLSPVEVVSRMTVNDAARLDALPPPPYRASLSLGHLGYSVSPTLLVALLLAGAALLLAAAIFLVVRFGRRSRPAPPRPVPAPAVVLSPLERALLDVERARAAGIVPDERKALESLARELGRNGDSQVALTAKGLAWSEVGPVPAATVVLIDDVRTLIERSGDGHPH